MFEYSSKKDVSEQIDHQINDEESSYYDSDYNSDDTVYDHQICIFTNEEYRQRFNQYKKNFSDITNKKKKQKLHIKFNECKRRMIEDFELSKKNTQQNNNNEIIEQDIDLLYNKLNYLSNKSNNNSSSVVYCNDNNFPSLSLEHKKQNNNDIDDWITINKKNRIKIQTYESNSFTNNKQTTSYNSSFTNNKQTTSYNSSSSNNTIYDCKYTDCFKVKKIGNDTYVNTNIDNKCVFLHKSESKDSYNNRLLNNTFYIEKKDNIKVLSSIQKSNNNNNNNISKIRLNKLIIEKDKLCSQIKDNDKKIERFSSRDTDLCNKTVKNLKLENITMKNNVDNILEDIIKEELKYKESNKPQNNNETKSTVKKQDMKVIEIIQNDKIETKNTTIDNKTKNITIDNRTTNITIDNKTKNTTIDNNKIIKKNPENVWNSISNIASKISDNKIINKESITKKNEEDNTNKNGGDWKLVTNTNNKKKLTEKVNNDKIKSNTKTRMCKNKNSCYRKECNYAHKFDELNFKECLYGERCRLIILKNNVYENSISQNSSDFKCCLFKHNNESKNNLFNRLGKFI